jgi:hypothetical protein
MFRGGQIAKKLESGFVLLCLTAVGVNENGGVNSDHRQ